MKQAKLKSVCVELYVDGRRLPIYDDPDEETDSTSTKQRFYIEAVTDAAFEIKTTLDRNFSWGTCDGVKLNYLLDGTAILSYFSKKPDWRHKHKHLIHTVNHVIDYAEESGQWREGLLSFGRLETKEFVLGGATHVKINKLGSIKVTVSQVVENRRRNPVAFTPAIVKPPSEVQETALKGRALSNIIKTMPGDRIAAPEAITHSYAGIDDSVHVPIEVEILHRSKEILSILGCIQSAAPVRSPTAIDALAFSGAHTNGPVVPHPPGLSPSPYQEIQDLRPRLALLEQSLNIKAEPVDAPVSPGTVVRFKRERFHTDGDDAHKRRKRSGAAEVVDLTVD